MNFKAWCSEVSIPSGAHTTQVVTVKDRESGIERIAAKIPDHYLNVAASLAVLGKDSSANIIRNILPKSKRMRSADVGEILAAEWIDECSGKYRVPIKRLRGKASSESSMPGVDVIGIDDTTDPLVIHFLKGEAKSRIRLTPAVIRKARESLDEDDGNIGAESLTFILRKLIDENREIALALKISKAMIEVGIPVGNVRHIVFTVSGNDPTNILQDSLSLYEGDIDQMYVGIHVNSHKDFVCDIYAKVQGDV